jgi:hypothetical protein
LKVARDLEQIRTRIPGPRAFIGVDLGFQKYSRGNSTRAPN